MYSELLSWTRRVFLASNYNSFETFLVEQIVGFIFIFLLAHPLQAQIIIKAVVPEKQRVVIQSETGFEVGQIIEATSEMNEKCEMRITKVKGKIAAADTSKCVFASEFKVGQNLLSSESQTNSEENPIPLPGKIRHSLGGLVYYSLANNIESASGVGDSRVTVTDVSSSALGLGGSYKFEYGSGGAQTAIMYELPRNISERKVAGLTSRYNPVATLSLIVFEISGFYSFGPFAPYIGFNYNIPNLSNGTTMTIAGAFGTQIGLTWKISKVFTLDAGYRTLNFTITEAGSPYESSRLWGFVVKGLAYFF